MPRSDAIELNHQVQNVIHLLRLGDTDDFGLRLSRNIQSRLSASGDLAKAVAQALAETRTSLFRRQRGSRAEFERRLVESLLLSSPAAGALGAVREFVRFAERQLAQELWTNRSDEGVLRSHMQSFLEGRLGKTFKEVVTGRGRTDIMLVDDDSSEVIEAKLWKGEQYFRDGIEELAEYLRTQNLARGHYVVLDCSRDNELTRQKGAAWAEEFKGRLVHVFFVQISAEPPSKLGRARRKMPPS